MEWYWWLIIALCGIFAVAITVAVKVTIKLCEFRYYGSSINWWDLPRNKKYFIRGVAVNSSDEAYIIVQDKKRRETFFILLPCELNPGHLSRGDVIAMRREKKEIGTDSWYFHCATKKRGTLKISHYPMLLGR